nr:hypothetical protein [Gammaproteobacteria bacterium]
SIGLVALLTALIMLDIAVFFTLKTYFLTKITAFILAGANGLLFLIFILFSKRNKHQKEVEALKDIRNFAKEEVTKDLKVVKDEVVEIGHSVGHVVHDVSSVLSGEAFGLARILPILHQFLKSK